MVKNIYSATSQWAQARRDASVIFLFLGPVAFWAPKGSWILIFFFFLFRRKYFRLLDWRDVSKLVREDFVYLLLPVWALISSIWAIEPANSVATSLKLFVYILLAVAVVAVVRRSTPNDSLSALTWTAIGVGLSNLIIWAEIWLGGPLYEMTHQFPFSTYVYSRGAVIVTILLLPVVVGLGKFSKPGLAVFFAVTSVASIFLLANESAKLAVIVGAAVFFLVRWRSRLFWPLVSLPLACIVAMPMLFAGGLNDNFLCWLQHQKPSAAHRLLIYEFSSQRIYEKPFFGWGMDSARSVPGGQSGAIIPNCPYKAGGRPLDVKSGDQLPLHPHSAALQLWLELGLFGVVVTIGALVRLLFVARRRFAKIDEGALVAGVFSSLFIVYSISFGMWQSWLSFSVILLFALVAGVNGAWRSKSGADRTDSPKGV